MRLGVDLGGTKIEIAVFDERGNEVVRRRAPTPRAGYDAALAEFSALILEAEKEAGARCSIGIGMPGTIAPRSGRVVNAYNTPFNGRRLKQDLEQIIGREIRFANDANCFVLSEAIDGAARAWSLAPSSAPARAAASSSTDRCCTGTTASAANGAIPRCRG